MRKKLKLIRGYNTHFGPIDSAQIKEVELENHPNRRKKDDTIKTKNKRPSNRNRNPNF